MANEQRFTFSSIDNNGSKYYYQIVNNGQRSVSVQALKRRVVPVRGARGALSWLDGSQKLAMKTSTGSSACRGSLFL